MESSETETERLAFVKSLQIVDTPIEERFERINRLVNRVFDSPVSAISIIDREREWFKSIIGSKVVEIPREYSLGATAIAQDEVFLMHSLTSNPDYLDNPLVAAGMDSVVACPITLTGNIRIGVLAVYDTGGRQLEEQELQVLGDFADTTASEMKARLMNNVYNSG